MSGRLSGCCSGAAVLVTPPTLRNDPGYLDAELADRCIVSEIQTLKLLTIAWFQTLRQSGGADSCMVSEAQTLIWLTVALFQRSRRGNCRHLRVFRGPDSDSIDSYMVSEAQTVDLSTVAWFSEARTVI